MDSEQVKVEQWMRDAAEEIDRNSRLLDHLAGRDVWMAGVIASHAPTPAPTPEGRTLTEMWEPMACGHQNMFLYAIPGAPTGLQCALCRIKELETDEPEHNCATDDRRLPINRPCSACSGGDPEMKYHLHCPPFRQEPVPVKSEEEASMRSLQAWMESRNSRKAE